MSRVSLKKLHRNCAAAAALAMLALAVSAPVQAASRSAKAPARAQAKEAASEPPAAKFVAEPGALLVSDRELNAFVFSAPVKQIIFPSDAPVSGEPQYLSGATQVLVQFTPSEKSVQMIVELNDDTVQKLRVSPRPVPGATHLVGNAKPKRAAATAEPASRSSDPRAEDIALLKRIVMGDVPDSMSSVDLPRPTRFDKFTVIPMAAWSDGERRRAFVFSLVAVPGQTAVVAPPQFYRPGITAVMVDGDVVDANTTPTLYVLEELSDEQ